MGDFLIPPFEYTPRRSYTSINHKDTMINQDRIGQQIILITDAINSLNKRLDNFVEEMTSTKTETKRGPGRPKKQEDSDGSESQS